LSAFAKYEKSVIALPAAGGRAAQAHHRRQGAGSCLFGRSTGGVLAQLGLSVTAGLDQWRLTVVGDEGSLTVPDEGTTLLRQRYDDAEPLVVNFPPAMRRVTRRICCNALGMH
jgi:hypothetical protein